MAKEKQYVFSAKTTEEGLKQLNRLRQDKGVGWNDLVLDAICAHYGLDKAVMALPKKQAATKKNTEISDKTAPANGDTKSKDNPKKS